jgi:mannosylglycerate hydrolase
MVEEKNFKAIITPESHWDREWYLPFNEYRARLVTLMDRLLDIYNNNPDYTNFTMDGQAIPIEDYLEVRAEKFEEVKKRIQEGKLSVGPLYVLPDEYLISGEAFIRNFMIGIQVSKKFGKYMKAGYIPDPFGHIAQLPQLIEGFGLNGVLFARGNGNEFDDLKLNIEFNWHAPGKAATTLAIFLKEGYGSVAHLPDQLDNGEYKLANRIIDKVIEKLGKYSATDTVILNNGSDHLLAQEFLPDLIKKYNAKGKHTLIQADFEEYLMRIKNKKLSLKDYEGELHGGKYQQILSGVFSARMWIKQKNYECQTLLERYSEPSAAAAWLLASNYGYQYPHSWLTTAWKTLIQNHPHDSICGCSVDEVHEVDMKKRFSDAYMMGNEITKMALNDLSYVVNWNDNDAERIPMLLFNPLPWNREDNVCVKLIVQGKPIIPIEECCVKDASGKVVHMQIEKVSAEPRFTFYDEEVYALYFHVELPAFGYAIYYLYPGEECEEISDLPANGTDWIENKYYKIYIHQNGKFDVFDKVNQQIYKDLGVIQDTGDWGDEYDFSGPNSKLGQSDLVIESDVGEASISTMSGAIFAKAEIVINVQIPSSLTYDKNRTTRSENMENNIFYIDLILNKFDPVIRIKVRNNNTSRDHRMRMLFPTSIKSDTVHADGHFYIVPRSVHRPKDDDWIQKWQPTHHQHKFVSVWDDQRIFTVLNKGLPEYEAMVDPSTGNITFAITLLRCIEWLSRGDMATRNGNAGPSIYTPKAQCIDFYTFDLGLVLGKGDMFESNHYRLAEEYHAPSRVFSPYGFNNSYRKDDSIYIQGLGFSKSLNYNHNPTYPESMSILSLEGRKLTISAIKKSEYDDSLIVRVVNMASTKEKGILSLFKQVKECAIVNLNEESAPILNNATIKTQGQKIEMELNPHVILTIKIKF